MHLMIEREGSLQREVLEGYGAEMLVLKLLKLSRLLLFPDPFV